MLQNQVRPFMNKPAEVVWEGTVNVKHGPGPAVATDIRSLAVRTRNGHSRCEP